MDREHSAVGARLDDVAARHWRQTEVAANEVLVIVRQQHDVAGADHHALAILAVDPDMKLALNDVVIRDQVRGWSKRGRAMLRPDARGHAPWR